MELCEEDDLTTDSSADWTNQITRGGLKLVNNKTYQFFHAIEVKVRQHFNMTSAPTLTAGFKAALLETVKADDDVLFHWEIIAVEWEEGEEQALLHMIIDLWITIRGFSFAKSWLEMYKQEKKKSKSQKEYENSSLAQAKATRITFVLVRVHVKCHVCLSCHCCGSIQNPR